LSQWLADPLHPSVHSREKWLAGKVFEWVPGLDVVTVNPGWFADNYMAALESITQFGVMAMPLGEGLNAPPANEDIARVIVGALTHPELHIGKTYRPTGPRLLSPDEIAAIFGKVLGRPVRYRNAPLKLFLKMAKALGYADWVISQLYWFLQEYQRNAFGVGAPTSAVLDVSGEPPEEFEQIARRYLAATPLVRRTLNSRMRAVRNIVRAILTPSPNPEGIARRADLPNVDHAMFAGDSVLWRRAHDPEGVSAFNPGKA
jgi:hypothetical protein